MLLSVVLRWCTYYLTLSHTVIHCCTMSNPGKTYYIIAEQLRASLRCLTQLYVFPLFHIRASVHIIFSGTSLYYSPLSTTFATVFSRAYSRTLRCLTLVSSLYVFPLLQHYKSR